MLRCTTLRRRVPRPVVDEGRLATLLAKLDVDLASLPNRSYVGVAPSSGASAGNTIRPTLHALDDFAPLFSPHFVFEKLKWQALGRTTIQSCLASSVYDFVLHRELAVSTNVVNQLVACLHNAASMRYFAEQLGMVDLATLTLGDGSFAEGRNTIDQLREEPVGPSNRDLKGTAFEVPTPAGCVTPWVAHLAHVIGAIRVHFGADVAKRAVGRLWGLDGNAAVSNLPMLAARLLTEVASTQAAGSVAEALLAAQGIAIAYDVRHFPLKLDDAIDEAKNGMTPATGNPLEDEPERKEEPGAGAGLDSAVATVKHQAGLSSAAVPEQNQLETLGGTTSNVTATEAASSLAAGPGLVDLIAKFEQRHGSHSNEGWLTTPEATPWKSSKVTFASLSHGDAYLADLVGVKQPQQGAMIGRVAFRRRQDDPDFFGATANKDGIAIDTFGVSSADYVRSFRASASQQRMFEVSLITYEPVGRGGIVASKSVAKRYSVARNGAAAGYLEGVLIDLMRLTSLVGDPKASAA